MWYFFRMRYCHYEIHMIDADGKESVLAKTFSSRREAEEEANKQCGRSGVVQCDVVKRVTCLVYTIKADKLVGRK